MKRGKDQTQLMQISDLENPDALDLVKHITVSHRIDSLLEDLNVDPISIDGSFRIGETGRRTHVLHASGLGGTSGKSLCRKFPMGCSRELFYSLTGADAEKSFDPRRRRILDTGTALHSMLQAYLSTYAQLHSDTESFTPEADINPELNDIASMFDISGHSDGEYTIRTPTWGVRFGVEIKTINDNGYKATNRPHQEHLVQGTIYQKCLDLPVMLFLYYNKNDSSMAEFIQVYDPVIWSAVEAKIKHIRPYALKGTPPEQEVTVKCGTCIYKHICKPPMKGQSVKIGAHFRKRSR